MDEVTREWRKLHNEEFNDLYSSPNIVQVIKSRRGHLEDPGVDERITVRWIFRKWDGGGMDWVDLAQERDNWRTFVNAVMNLRIP